MKNNTYSPYVVRKQKTLARNEALEFCNQPDTMICLPSAECACILQEYEEGRITLETNIIAIEHDADYAAIIKAKLARKGFKHVLVLRSEIFRVTRAELLTFGKIDFAYFDLCGNMTPAIKAWYEQNRDCFSGPVIWTLFGALRGRADWSAYKTNYERDEISAMKAVQAHSDFRDSLTCGVRDLNGFTDSSESSVYHLAYAWSAMAARKIAAFRIYTDKRAPMMQVIFSPKTDWSAAGRKAWVTRRKNAA